MASQTKRVVVALERIAESLQHIEVDIERLTADISSCIARYDLGHDLEGHEVWGFAFNIETRPFGLIAP